MVFNKKTCFLFFLLTLFSINNYGQKKSKLTFVEKSFTKEKTKDTIIYDQTKTCYYSAEFKISWFNKKNKIADSLNNKIFQTIRSIVYSENNTEKATNYEELIIFFIDDNLDEQGAYFEASASVVWKNQSIINVFVGYEIYSGGAHGSRGSISLFFDPKTGKEILTNDLFNDREAFKKIAEHFFRKEFEIPDDQEDINSAGFWFENNVFELPRNIFIINGYVQLVYNLYEIAGYADGPKIVDIPISEVNKFITYDILNNDN